MSVQPIEISTARSLKMSAAWAVVRSTFDVLKEEMEEFKRKNVAFIRSRVKPSILSRLLGRKMSEEEKTNIALDIFNDYDNCGFDMQLYRQKLRILAGELKAMEFYIDNGGKTWVFDGDVEKLILKYYKNGKFDGEENG